MQSEWARMLEKCEANFGDAPRRLPMSDRIDYLKIRLMWLVLMNGNKLNIQHRRAFRALRKGIVVWGHIVQANRLLFETSEINCPANVVYSLEDRHKVTPEYLEQLAHQLFSLKGKRRSDPQEAKFSANLANERTPAYGWPVPKSLSPDVRCRMSSTFFLRKFLPGQRLCGSLLPIVVNPEKPLIVVPLPGRYWPDELLNHWVM